VDLKKEIIKQLKGSSRVVLLGVGSDLRGDDIAGILVAQELEKFKPAKRSKIKFKVFLGGTAPENLTGSIKKFRPSHIIIIDAAQMKKKAGAIRLLKDSEIRGICFCTHQLPLNMISHYLKASIKSEVIIIGIQPKVIKFGAGVSQEVKKSAKQVAGLIKGILKA
jgi:hydrogenase 3 maturation protease